MMTKRLQGYFTNERINRWMDWIVFINTFLTYRVCVMLGVAAVLIYGSDLPALQLDITVRIVVKYSVLLMLVLYAREIYVAYHHAKRDVYDHFASEFRLRTFLQKRGGYDDNNS